MKSVLICIFCLMPAFLSIGCNENASTPGYEDPTDPNLAPRVVWTWLESPRNYYRDWEKATAHTDTLPYNYYPGRLLVRFNKIMVGYTVIPNVSLTPEESGYAAINHEGSISVDGQTFEFPIYGMFKIARRYTVSVGENATDVTGLRLEAGYSKELVPEPALRVINTYPEPGDTSFYPGQSVYFYLNSSIDPRSIADNCFITPRTSGKWYQQNYYTPALYFTPDSGFRANTTYQFTLLRTLADSLDNNMQNDFTLIFRTVRFKVSHTYPYSGQPGVPTNESIFCYFTSSIDTNSVKEMVHISPDVIGTFRFPAYYPADYCYFKPSTALSPATLYTVTLAESLRSLSGDLLSSSFTFRFSTSP